MQIFSSDFLPSHYQRYWNVSVCTEHRVPISEQPARLVLWGVGRWRDVKCDSSRADNLCQSANKLRAQVSSAEMWASYLSWVWKVLGCTILCQIKGQGMEQCWSQLQNKQKDGHLSCEWATKVHGARARLVGLQPEHCRGCQFVMCTATTWLLLKKKTTHKYQKEASLLQLPQNKEKSKFSAAVAMWDDEWMGRVKRWVVWLVGLRPVFPPRGWSPSSLWFSWSRLLPSWWGWHQQSHGPSPTDTPRTHLPQSTCTTNTSPVAVLK